MPPDIEVIRRKIRLILGDIEQLKEYSALDRESFLADQMHQSATERVLERMIGRMIDINYLLVTGHGELPPSNYGESFLQLAKLGVLDRDFAKTMVGSAGLRNRLAHEYDDIDPAKIHEAAHRALADVPRYLMSVESFLSKA